MQRQLLGYLFLVVQGVALIAGNDITRQVFGNINEGIVAAYGDFNSDEHTDIFVIRDKMSAMQILFGAETEPLLREGPRCNYTGYDVVSLVPGDFDGDALMDVLVVLQSKYDRDDIYEIQVNWGNGEEVNCTQTTLLKSKGEPLAMDFNQDMIIDLYGLDDKGQRIFWIFNKLRNKPEERHQMAPDGSTTFQQSISIPNANAYLDLNEDFAADLLVQTDKYYEIWNGHSKGDFAFNRTIDLNIIGLKDYTIGQAVFMDFELTGVQNVILPICLQSQCANSTILVHDGENFRDVHVNFKDSQGVNWVYVKPDGKDVYLKTITARSGDYNMDGYPDLLMTLQSLNEPRQIKTFLLENVPCKTCNKPLKRTFEVKWNALNINSASNQIVAGAFYDFYQDGVLDVILIERTSKGVYRPLAFRNSLDYDANFVKVIVLTGLVNEKNYTLRTPLGRKRRTYGTNLPGPRITYYTTTQDGDQQFGSSVQLPQSSYHALQLPYTIFGLGRTPNFVDQLTVGLAGISRTWTQLIPNSQIIVVPKPLEEPQRWKAQLFVTPSKLILMSVVALGGTCLFIVLIILVLYIKEKREDKLEKLQEAHRFHFDAM